MIEFSSQIRNEKYKKDDKEFEIQLQNLLESSLNKYYEIFHNDEKIQLYFFLYNYVDELKPLAMIEPNFNKQKISIKYIWIQLSPSRWYFTTNGILRDTILHEGLHYTHQFLKFKRFFIKYQKNNDLNYIIDMICDINLIPYIKELQISQNESDRMLIGRILNLMEKENRIFLVKNFCENRKIKDIKTQYRLNKPSIYLLSILFYSKRYFELTGKKSKIFNHILRQIEGQDIEFKMKEKIFNSIFDAALFIKNGKEMEEILLKLNSFKDILLKNNIWYKISFDLKFKKYQSA